MRTLAGYVLEFSLEGLYGFRGKDETGQDNSSMSMQIEGSLAPERATTKRNPNSGRAYSIVIV